MRATKIRTVQGCQRIQVAHQLCPRKYHVYTRPIPPTHTDTRRSTRRTRNERSHSALIPGQRRRSNGIHVCGGPIPSRLRARPKAPACHRAFRRTMRASMRWGRSTSNSPRRAARRGRRVAAVRSGSRSGPRRSRRRPMRALRCPRGICTGASWVCLFAVCFWRDDAGAC